MPTWNSVGPIVSRLVAKTSGKNEYWTSSLLSNPLGLAVRVRPAPQEHDHVGPGTYQDAGYPTYQTLASDLSPIWVRSESDSWVWFESDLSLICPIWVQFESDLWVWLLNFVTYAEKYSKKIITLGNSVQRMWLWNSMGYLLEPVMINQVAILLDMFSNEASWELQLWHQLAGGACRSSYGGWRQTRLRKHKNVFLCKQKV